MLHIQNWGNFFLKYSVCKLSFYSNNRGLESIVPITAIMPLLLEIAILISNGSIACSEFSTLVSVDYRLHSCMGISTSCKTRICGN